MMASSPRPSNAGPPAYDGPAPEIHANLFIGLAALAFALTTMSVGMRTYVRKIMTKSFASDDWILLAAYGVFVVYIALLVAYATENKLLGFGATINQHIIVFNSWLSSVDQVLIKGSLAALYVKVLPIDSWQRKVLIAGYTIYACFTTIFAFLLLFQCGNPLAPHSAKPKCLDMTSIHRLSFTSNVFNALTDWLLTLMPVSVIYKSSMAQRTKMSIIFVMLVGGLASIISVVRIHFDALGHSQKDALKDLTPFIMLALWENCVGIMAVSLTALRPLLRRFLGATTVQPSQDFDWTMSISSDNPRITLRSRLFSVVGIEAKQARIFVAETEQEPTATWSQGTAKDTKNWRQHFSPTSIFSKGTGQSSRGRSASSQDV